MQLFLEQQSGQNEVQSEVWSDSADEGHGVREVPPLTREEAEVLRQKLGGVNLESFLLKVLVWQAVAAIAIAAAAWAVSFSTVVVISAVYGAMCVVLPSALVARTVIKRVRRKTSKHPGGMSLGLVGLELVKVLVTVCLLVAAHFVLDSPQWVAIVVGFAVTLKVYWVVAFISLRRPGMLKKLG